MSFVRGVYVVAIGVLIVLLVMFGIQAFYPEPERGDSPSWERHREQMAVYHSNVFLIVLPLGAVLAVVGAFVRGRRNTIGASLILGGTGIMIYGVTFWHLDSLWRFVGIAATLAVLVLVGFKVLPALRRDSAV